MLGEVQRVQLGSPSPPDQPHQPPFILQAALLITTVTRPPVNGNFHQILTTSLTVEPAVKYILYKQKKKIKINLK